MFRKNWWNPRFWHWWWHNQAPIGAQAIVLLLAFTLIVGAGWLAADRLSSAGAGVNTNVLTYTSTVERVVTVRSHPRSPRAAVVVRTVHDKQLVPKLRTVTQRLTTAKPVTVVKTRTRTSTRVVPDLRTITRQETTTTTETQVQTQTETSTLTLTETQVRTETQRRTVTQTRTVTVIVTVTVPK